jgi:hypothetical protein
MSYQLTHPSQRLFVVGTIRRIIRGLDLREPLHADGMDFCDTVLERDTLDTFLDLAILELAFRSSDDGGAFFHQWRSRSARNSQCTCRAARLLDECVCLYSSNGDASSSGPFIESPHDLC